jgi:hypothetical protein
MIIVWIWVSTAASFASLALLCYLPCTPELPSDRYVERVAEVLAAVGIAGTLMGIITMIWVELT